MVASRAPEGFLHARPMGSIAAEPEGALWFFTSRKSPVVSELKADPEVLVTYADTASQHYVSVSGRASVVDDPAKAKALWREPLRTWFPNGPEDPDLVLVRVEGERAQYWDAPSSTVVYAYGYVKARLTGERPEPGEAGKVRL